MKSKNKKGTLYLITKIISWCVMAVLCIIGALLITYIAVNKIALAKGQKQPLGLYTIISPSMTGTLNVYDVAFTMRVDTDKLKEGDIITFYSTNSFFGGTPITHRIIEIVNLPESGKMFRVKGDANPKADEEKVIPSNVVGKVLFKIPQLGRVQFFLASKGGWIIAIMIPALVIISYDIYKIFRLVLLKSKLLSMENEHGNI